MSKQYNFAIVGYGRIGQRFAQKIAENDQAELVGVADVKLNQLELIKDKKVLTTRDFRIFIHDPKIDIVYVSVPNHLHAQISMDFLEAGKHVICEKPMALTVHDADKMILAAQKSKAELFIVKQNRFNPPVAKVKELIDSNKLGHIYQVIVNCLWNRGADYYLDSDWKGKKNFDGGTLYTQFSHFIDIVYFLLGDFSSVYAQVNNFNHQETIEFEDTGVINIKMANGTLGCLNYTTSAYQKNFEGSVTLICENGTVKIGGEYLNTLEFFNVKNMEKPTISKGNLPNNYGNYQGSMSNHDKILANVIATLSGNDTIATSGFEGMKTVQVIQAIYESANKNLPVGIR